MAEQSPFVDRSRLEAALGEVGRHIVYPPTPSMERAVRVRLALDSPTRWKLWPKAPSLRFRFAFGAMVVLAASLVGLVISPTARLAVAERLGLPGIRIFQSPRLEPSAAQRASKAAVTRQGLGPRVTLSEAKTRVTYAVLQPTAPELGPPDEVYVAPAPPGGQVALLYTERPGIRAPPETDVALLLTQFDGSLVRGYSGKGLPPGTRLEDVNVGGGYGQWIEGTHPYFAYQDRNAQFQGEPTRLAANTLLWQRGDIVLRLEGALGKDAMVRIATSVQPVP